MERKNSVTYVGLSFVGALTIALIVLKLLHVIEWSWLLVFSPILIGIALKILASLVILLIALWGLRK